MEILKNFGVDPYLLVAQIINFLIVFFILKVLLYKPFMAMLKKRSDQVAQGIKDAQESEKLLLETQEKEKAILKKAEESADKIVNDAKLASVEQAREIEDNAKQQSEKILSQAKEKIEQDTKEAEEKLAGKIGKIAISVLEKALPNILSKKDQEEVLKKAASEIK